MLAVIGGLSWSPSMLFAATVEVTERSEPAGIVSRTTFVETSTEHLTLTAPEASTGYRFTHWTLNGVGQVDVLGQALNPVRFIVYEAVDAVARYLPVDQDTVGDGIPDWWRLRYYGDLDEAAGSDTDGDGLTLAEEYRYDTNPRVPEIYVYVELSEPDGLLKRSVVVSNLMSATSQTLWGETQGCAFAYWEVRGERQADSLGVSLSSFTIQITNHTVAMARYLPVGQDTVGDGIPDWCRLRYYGDLDEAADSDTDGDGLTLAEEYRYDFNPVISNTLISGGVSMRNSEMVTVLVNPDFHVYTERSEPGGLVERSMVVSNLSMVTSQTLGGETQGLAFVCWEVGGERQADGLGMSLSSFTITITNTMIATAKYLPVDQDTVGDGIPDWWRLRYYGDLDETADSDTDGDGLTLAKEYSFGTSPLTPNLCIYSECSDPGGLVDRSVEVSYMTTLTSQTLWGQTQGCVFAYWETRGERQADSLGISLSSFTITITNTTIATARYLPADQDTVGDGIPDWWRLRYYGDLEESAGSDTDGDGLTLAEECRYDFNPVISNTLLSGGVSMRNSEMVTVDLQPFERVEHVLVDGILTSWFTVCPTGQLGAAAFSGTPMPALGDWDGDGDLDVFVGASGGVMRIYENIGSKTMLNIVDRSASFSDLAGKWSGIMTPCPALGDWDSNGRADLAIGGAGGAIRLISSTANFVGSHSPSVDYAIDTGSTSAIPAFADVVGSTNLDLLGMLEDGTVRAYWNTGDPLHPYDSGSYTDNVLGVSVPGATGLAGKDLDRDGYDDVLVSDVYGRIWAFHQNADRTFTLKSKVWGGSGSGFANGLTVALGDLDGDSDVDALCGFSGGGLICLRDPGIGVPAGLHAFDGANSILLMWDPCTHYRFRGYYPHRSPGSGMAFSRINTILPLSRYVDMNVTAGGTYFYYVTALSAAIYPGNTAEKLLESKPSETVSATCGKVVMWLSDYNAAAGSVATLKVNANNASGISGNGMDVRITYDPSVIKPVTQVIASNRTVELTVLTQGLTVSDNAETANGELRITGSGGVVSGEGHLFDVRFFVLNGVPGGTVSTNTFSMVSLKNQAGAALTVDYSAKAVLVVTGAFIRGDVDGNQAVDHDDCKVLQQIVVSKLTPTGDQLKAGDMDGNGYLDHNDFKLLHDYHLGKPTNPKE
jgi:hypothetical protein